MCRKIKKIENHWPRNILRLFDVSYKITNSLHEFFNEIITTHRIKTSS